MASVNKRFRNRGGQTVASTAWYINFMDHMQRARRLKGFADKTASEEAGRKIERLVSLRLAGEAPDAALTRWLEDCPAPMRAKLGAWGIITRTRVAAGKPLAEHLADWRQALLTKGTSAGRARDNHYRVSRVFIACGFLVWSDIDPLAVQRRLAAWVKDGTLSPQTRNHYVQHLKQFGRWMVDHGRASESPLRMLTAVALKGDHRRKRRALTSEEFAQLLDAAHSDPEVVEGLDGPARAALYRTARRTGLRWSELRALRCKAFDLDPNKPKIYLREEDEKHPRGDPVALTHDAAEALRAYFAAHPKAENDPAFRLSRRNVGAEMVRHDLARARIPYRNADGEIFDFHAIRGQLGTDLARAGVPLQQTQCAMRHSNVNLTLKYYTHLNLEDQRQALERLTTSMPPADAEQPPPEKGPKKGPEKGPEQDSAEE